MCSRPIDSCIPNWCWGLSDHTPGHATVLGAIALGARVIEKHFTDDRQRTGPDHAFSMDPASWRDMVDRARELEQALGHGCKRIEENEQETVVLQRRAIRLKRAVEAGEPLSREDLCVLRPCPTDGLPPHALQQVIGRSPKQAMSAGQHLRWIDLNEPSSSPRAHPTQHDDHVGWIDLN